MTTVLLPPAQTVQSLNERAFAAMQQGQWQAAMHLLESAVPLVTPAQEPALYSNLGQCSLLGSQIARANEYLQRALEYPQPREQRACILTNLSIVDRLGMRIADSMAHIQEAVQLGPKLQVAHLNRVICADLDPDTGPEAQLAYRRAYSKTLVHRSRRFPAKNRDPGRPIKVGYVSGNFAEHSAAYAFQPIITGHSEAILPICYSTWQQDAATARFQRPGVGWVDGRGWDTDQLLKRIVADDIDILVDLSGHTAGGQLPMFALRAAPIQVTAWGYALTTGLPEMDVMFTERTFCPPDFPWISEQRVYLPALIPQQPPGEGPPHRPRRPGPLRFGYGGSPAKLNPIILARWAALLQARPDATLECQYLGFEQQAVQLMVLQALGADPRRVTFGPMLVHGEHLEHVAEWDVALDAWPHTGGVTTLDATMCGVPTLALCQPHGVLASRTSSSLLRTMGLGAWVAQDTEQWLALGCAIDADRIDRAAIRLAFEASPVRDLPAYVQAVEAAYRDLWQEWCPRGR